MAKKKCFSTGADLGSDKWKLDQACYCVNCAQFRDSAMTNHDASRKRQYISVKFDIDLPLKQHEVVEAVSLLESLLHVLRSAVRESPQTVDAAGG